MTELFYTDVIVVGSGCTGGWVAHELTQNGVRVLLLEAGPSLELGKDVTDEAWKLRPPTEATSTERQPMQSRSAAYNDASAHLFVDDLNHPIESPEDKPFVWIRSRKVGGRSLLWLRATVRMSPRDFKPASTDGIGDDWPIGYDDLSPYYDRIERFMAVEGNAEGIDIIPDGHYKTPPPFTPAEVHLKKSVEERWKTRRVTFRRAIPLAPRGDLGQWPLFTSQGSTLAAAERTGLMELRPNAVVSEVLVDPKTGRALGVRYIDSTTGKSHEVRARAVVLAASTLESTRILMLSKSAAHPSGIGGASGVLGRYLMDHVSAAVGGVTASLPTPAETPNEGPAHWFYIPQFKNNTEPTKDFARGYAVLGHAHRSIRPGTFLMLAMGEMLPKFENRTELHPTLKDEHGLPTLRFDCAWSENDRKMMDDMVKEMTAMAAAAGFEVKQQRLNVPGECVHEIGTARMGSDPRSSVVNPNLEAWDSKGLFVVDGAVWVSSATQNPTLTMMALAARAADHILDRLRVGDFD